MSTKLTRVHARLYEEPREDGRPFNYAKQVEQLDLALYELRIQRYAQQQGP